MINLPWFLFQVIRLGMFEVHCDELIRALSKRADALCSKLLARMCQDHQDANKAYVETNLHNYYYIPLKNINVKWSSLMRTRRHKNSHKCNKIGFGCKVPNMGQTLYTCIEEKIYHWGTRFVGFSVKKLCCFWDTKNSCERNRILTLILIKALKE